jgi:hypothetical protein
MPLLVGMSCRCSSVSGSRVKPCYIIELAVISIHEGKKCIYPRNKRTEQWHGESVGMLGFENIILLA